MKIPVRIALLVFALQVTAFSFGKEKATARTETADGLHVFTFGAASGRIMGYVTDDIRRSRPGAEEPHAGSLALVPEGKTEKERQKNLGKLQGMVVEIEGQEFSASEGQMRFVVPADRAAEFVSVRLKDGQGKIVAKTTVPCLPPPPEREPSGRPAGSRPSALPSSPSADDYELPLVAQAGRPTQIIGVFDLKSSLPALEIDEARVPALAMSPRKIVFGCPENTLGPIKIRLIDTGIKAEGLCRALRVSLAAPKTTLQKGESTTLTVRVEGLQNLPYDIPLELWKGGEVSMEGGDSQRLLIRPRDVKPGGTYTLPRVLTGLRRGSYEVTARVKPPDIHLELVSPESGSEVRLPHPTFEWVINPVIPDLEYSLKIYELLPGQNLSDCPSNTPHFSEKGIKTSSFPYPAGAPPLQANTRYGYRVKGLVQGSLAAKSEISGFFFKGPAAEEKDPCAEILKEIQELENELKKKDEELQRLPRDREETEAALAKCPDEREKAKKAQERARQDLQIKKNLKDNAEKNNHPDKEKYQKDYEEAQNKLKEATRRAEELAKKCEELRKKLEDLKEKSDGLPGETEALKGKLEELKKKLEECEEKKKEEAERRERETREEEERAEREKREKAEQAEAETRALEHTKYLLQNIKSLGLISSPGFWEAPGLWDWLPGLLKTPVGKLAEKLAKTPIPTSTLPALAGIYQIAGALLDPCTPDGKRKTVERLMRGDTGKKYSLEEALDKTDQMCDLLTRLKELAEMANKQK